MGEDRVGGLKSGKHALLFVKDLATRVDIMDLARTTYLGLKGRKDSVFDKKYSSILERHFIESQVP